MLTKTTKRWSKIQIDGHGWQKYFYMRAALNRILGDENGYFHSGVGGSLEVATNLERWTRLMVQKLPLPTTTGNLSFFSLVSESYDADGLAVPLTAPTMSHCLALIGSW